MVHQEVTLNDILYRIGAHKEFQIDEPLTEEERAFQEAYRMAWDINKGKTYLTEAAPLFTDSSHDSEIKLMSSRSISFEGIEMDVITTDTVHRNVDFNIPCIAGNLIVKRNYVSAYKDKTGMFGKGFLSNIELSVVYDSSTHMLELRESNGTVSRIKNIPPEYGALPVIDINEAKKEITYRKRMKYYIFHTDGRLKKIKDACGNFIEVRYYNGSKTVDKLVSSCGITLEFTYKDNKVAAIRDPLGRTVAYRYEGDFLAEVVLKNGGKVRYEYEGSNNRLIHIQDALRKSPFQAETDRYGKITQMACYGRTYQITCRPHERETEIAPGDAKQCRFCFKYDKDNLVTEYGKQEQQFFCGYDPLQRLTNNGVWKKEYDENGRITHFNSNGNARDFSYNQSGQISKIQFAGGRVLIFTYNTFGKVIEIKDTYDFGKNAVLKYEYDAHGRNTKKTMAEGQVYRYHYNTNDSVFPEAIVYANGFRAERRFDKANRKIADIRNGNESVYHYNNLNKIIETIYPDGNRDFRKYDINGKLTEVVPPQENFQFYETKQPICKFSFTYGDAGKAMSVRTPSGEMKMLPKRENKNSGDELCEYDFRGRIKVRRKKMHHTGQPEGIYQYKEYAYDRSGRLIEIKVGTEPCGSGDRPTGFLITQLAYDDRDNIISIRKNSGYEETRFYVEDHVLDTRKISIREDIKLTIKYRYNKRGLLEKMITLMEPEDSEQAVSGKKEVPAIRLDTYYAYNANGDLTAITNPSGKKLALEYDRDGRPIPSTENAFIQFPYLNRLLGMTVETYDLKDNRNAPLDTKSISNVSRGWDGKITCFNSQEGDYHFLYDGYGRLIKITHPNQKTEMISYDKVGNVLDYTGTDGQRLVLTYNSINRLKAIERQGYKEVYLYNTSGTVGMIIVT